MSNFEFDWAIAPVTPETFFNETYEKKHLVIKRNDPNYFSDLLSLEDIDRAVTSMSLYTSDLQVVKAGTNIRQSDYAYRTGYVNAAQVYKLFADGGTIILPQLHSRLPKLAAYCKALERVFSARLQTNIYMTPQQSQGFNAHYDNHDVLVLQIEGSKEWRIYDTPLELPLQDQGFSPERNPIGEETDRFILEAGDTLYIPRGLAHDAIATDDTSLHITTGVLSRRWSDVIVEIANNLARDEPAFRESLPPGFANDGFDLTKAREKAKHLLELLAEHGNVDAAINGFRDEFMSSRVPQVYGQLAQIQKLPKLAIESAVGARPNLLYQLSTQQSGENGDGTNWGSVRIACYGQVISLPAHAREAVIYALEQPRFAVSELPGNLDDEGKLVLVRRLIREGLMVMLD